ncbi:methyltransferase [Pseudonocardia ailaonensis]|uniref:Methyltransferase n=1 Tax=Pseudonocardia ailaonensis TaxID=367279 RepID=A0ABN2N6X2_9PSEU
MTSTISTAGTDTPSGTLAGPEAVLRIASGYRTARVLFTAVELGVFARLADGALDPHLLVEQLEIEPIGGRDLVLALLGLGLLERDERGHVRNTAAAARFLVPGGDAHIGGFLTFLDRVLHPAWDGLTERLRGGGAGGQAVDPFGELYGETGGRDGFLAAMDVLNAPIGEQLAGLDWSGISTVVDVGGARGNVAAALVDAHPHLTATVFDLPGIEPAFTAHVEARGVADRVHFRAGDFFTDPLPQADAVVFGHVLHNWPERERVGLLRAAAAAVPAGGRVLVYDPILDATAPALNTVLASLNMLVWSAGGSEYTVAQLVRWLAGAGLSYVEHRLLGAGSTVVTARKRG